MAKMSKYTAGNLLGSIVQSGWQEGWGAGGAEWGQGGYGGGGSAYSAYSDPPEITTAKKVCGQAHGKPEWILVGFRKGPGEVQVFGTQKVANVQTDAFYESPSYFVSPLSSYGTLGYRIVAELNGLAVVEGMNWTQAMDGFPAPGEAGW